MAPRKRTITGPNGEPLTATIMPFQSAGEHFNEYLVEDGTVVKLKIVATEIMRVDGQYDPVTGDPIYLIQSTNVTNVSSPDELRKQG